MDDDNESNGWESEHDEYYEYGEDYYLQEERLLNEMYDFEHNFDLQEKENGKYYLGMYMNIQDVRMMSSGFLIGENALMFFGNAISTDLFFKYTFPQVIMYMKSIIMCRNMNPIVDIMQLIISDDGLYLAIIKTYWISLIQRHWKKIMKQKTEYIETQKSFQYIYNRELGKYNYKPAFSVIGMLSVYNNKVKNKKQL